MFQDMPQEVHAEILDLLQVLKGAWPLCRTIVHSDDGKSGSRIERYIKAVQWLTDRGLVTFEALMVDMRGLSIIQSSLTASGHEYTRSVALAGETAVVVSLYPEK